MRGSPGQAAKAHDFQDLRGELGTLADQLMSFVDELWPRLEDHKYRWQQYVFGVSDGYDKLIASDISTQVAEALKSIANGRDRLNHALVKAEGHTPGRPT